MLPCAIAFLLDQNLSESYLLSILNEFNNQRVTNLLIQRLDDATDDSIRLKFAKLLSLINSEEALSYLQELLNKPEEEIRLEAACTLQEISPNHPQVIPTLDNLLTNCQNNLLVYRAAMRLESIKPGSRNVQKAINKLLKSKDTSIVLKTARQWLENKANPYPYSYPLINILLKIVGSSENRYEREEAAHILLKISANDQNVTKSIIELFYKQPDEETHRVVAWYSNPKSLVRIIG